MFDEDVLYTYPSFLSIFVLQDDLNKVKWLAVIMDEVHDCLLSYTQAKAANAASI